MPDDFDGVLGNVAGDNSFDGFCGLRLFDNVIPGRFFKGGLVLEQGMQPSGVIQTGGNNVFGLVYGLSDHDTGE